jgi:type VI secretion system protein ImpB
MGDFSGDPTSELKPLSERKFIGVDRDNFDDVLARMTPGLNLKVENTIQGDGSEMGVQLEFKKMSDFDPGNVAKQVKPLKELLDARNKLKELQTTADLAGEKFEKVLEETLKSSDNVEKLGKELGVSGSDPEKGGDE